MRGDPGQITLRPMWSSVTSPTNSARTEGPRKNLSSEHQGQVGIDCPFCIPGRIQSALGTDSRPRRTAAELKTFHMKGHPPPHGRESGVAREDPARAASHYGLTPGAVTGGPAAQLRRARQPGTTGPMQGENLAPKGPDRINCRVWNRATVFTPGWRADPSWGNEKSPNPRLCDGELGRKQRHLQFGPWEEGLPTHLQTTQRLQMGPSLVGQPLGSLATQL